METHFLNGIADVNNDGLYDSLDDDGELEEGANEGKGMVVNEAGVLGEDNFNLRAIRIHFSRPSATYAGCSLVIQSDADLAGFTFWKGTGGSPVFPLSQVGSFGLGMSIPQDGAMLEILVEAKATAAESAVLRLIIVAPDNSPGGNGDLHAIAMDEVKISVTHSGIDVDSNNNGAVVHASDDLIEEQSPGAIAVMGSSFALSMKLKQFPEWATLPNPSARLSVGGGGGAVLVKNQTGTTIISSSQTTADISADVDGSGEVSFSILPEAPGSIQIMLEIMSSERTIASDWVQVSVANLDPQVTSVSFSGSGYKEIRKDDDSKSYTPPHWLDNHQGQAEPDGSASEAGDKRYPVCFVRQSTVYASCKIVIGQLASQAYGLEFSVKGEAGELTWGPAAGLRSGREVTMGGDAPIACSGTLPDTVSFMDPIQIGWEVSVNSGGAWANAGETDNRVYVTYAAPGASSTRPLYETIVDIGCRNADGCASEASIVGAIWGDFSDPAIGVTRKDTDGDNVTDGVEMRYWYNNPSADNLAQSIGNMLKPPVPGETRIDGNASCLAWSQVFKRTLDAQGLLEANEKPEAHVLGLMYHPDDQYARMLVKDWTFSGSGSLPGEYPYVVDEETTDQNGVAGQGNANPPGQFRNHFVVKYNGRIYDPSYGGEPFGTTAADCEQKHEDGSISGFSTLVVVIVDGVEYPTEVCKKNPDGSKEMTYFSIDGW
jgi:hypothetical protein